MTEQKYTFCGKLGNTREEIKKKYKTLIRFGKLHPTKTDIIVVPKGGISKCTKSVQEKIKKVIGLNNKIKIQKWSQFKKNNKLETIIKKYE